MRSRLARVLLGIGAVALLAAVALSVAGPSLLAQAVGYAGRLAGYNVAYGGLEARSGHLTILRPDVSSFANEPVLTAARIDLAYDLRRAFTGPGPYGISSVEIDRPKVTLIHHRDGSYNVVLPKSNPNIAPQPFAVPQLRLVVKDGSLGLIDQTRLFGHSRRLALENVQAAADLDPQRLSTFHFGLALLEEGGRFPISGRGRFDERRGYEIVRVRARSIGLAPLLDYALNSTSLHVAGGVLEDIDARAYGLLDRTGKMQRHLSIGAHLDHFQPYLNGLAKPLRDGRGRLLVYDDGIAIPRVDGSIAGVPVRIAGAIYGLAKPTLRLGITGKGDLHDLVSLNDAAKKLPLAGVVAFKLFVEGDAAQPTTLAGFASPAIAYGRVPLDKLHGLVALSGANTSILEAGISYAGASLGARGNLRVENKHTGVQVVANLAADAGSLPYGAALLGPMQVRATAVIAGVDASVATAGVLGGESGAERLTGTFALDPHGIGRVGPVSLDGPGNRSLYARVVLDQPRGAGGAAFVATSAFTLSSRGPEPPLPGISLAALPPVEGTLDASFAGTFVKKRYVVGGNAHAYGVHAFGVPIEDVRVQVSAGDREGIAAEGRYRGSLEDVARAARVKVAVRGRADIPISILALGGSRTVVQIHDARFERASVAGVPLGALQATVGLRGKALDVYAARVRLGGNDVVAQGSFGDGGTLAVSSGAIELAPFRALGLPVRSGSVAALAAITGSTATPQIDAGVAAGDITLPGAAYAGLALEASTGLTYRDDRLVLHDALVRAGPAVASLDGTLRGLRGDPRAVRYRFDAHVRQADIGTLAHAARAPLRYPAGTLDADLRVSGTGRSPAVAGTIEVPEGSLNGLRFRDAAVALAGDAAGVRARNGGVTFGSSRLAFEGDFAPDAQALSLHAPSVELGDFNDYFDRGDTLGGKGSIDAAVRSGPNHLSTSGRIRLAQTRFRRFTLGSATSDWSTAGRTVRTAFALGSNAGRLSASGDLRLAAVQPLRDALRRTSVALNLRAQNVALERWLPAAGIQAPVSGLVNAQTAVRGTYPDITAVAHADVRQGLIQGVRVHTATIDGGAQRGTATIARAELSADNLALAAAGSIGLRRPDPFDLTVTAQTPDLGALAKTLTGKTYDASGALQTTLHVTGTPARPVASDVLDAQRVRYGRYSLASAHAETSLTRTRAVLQRAEIVLSGGRILASGFAPLETKPRPGIGPPTSPIALNVSVQSVALAQFNDLLPKGTQLAGTLDGHAGLVGSLAEPGLDGTLALTGGSFVGPQERAKITNAVAQVTFAGRSASLHDASATVGGGTFGASGSVSVPDLKDPLRSAAVNLQATADRAVLDLPQYFRGRVDGALTLARQPAQSAVLGGKLAFTSARIPTSAILQSNSQTAASAVKPPDVAFALAIDVGRDVRVQGGVVDIGATGNLVLGGTLATPTLTGELDSTGGTISFYRTFRVQYPSTLVFDPSNGVIPDVDATATTNVDNPPTDVTLQVTGPTTGLNVALQSNPNYSREQILGLLVGAQALGAVSGIATTQNGSSQQNPFQAAAEGQLGTLLTQNLLEPLSSQIGSAVGLNNLAINYTPGGGVDVGAQKRLFRNVNAVFAESFNYPPRQSIGLVASPNASTAIQLTFFSQPSSNRFNTFEGAQSLQSSNNTVTSVQPASGTSGFSFSYQRKY